MAAFVLEEVAVACGLQAKHRVRLDIPAGPKRAHLAVRGLLPVKELLHRNVRLRQHMRLAVAERAQVGNGDEDEVLEGLDRHGLRLVAVDRPRPADRSPPVHVQTVGELRGGRQRLAGLVGGGGVGGLPHPVLEAVPVAVEVREDRAQVRLKHQRVDVRRPARPPNNPRSAAAAAGWGVVGRGGRTGRGGRSGWWRSSRSRRGCAGPPLSSRRP